MHGYLTMALETVEQLKGKCPTHIFLQAGVGSMAGAMCGFFASLYGPDVPVISIVEPKTADCVYRRAEKDDGKLQQCSRQSGNHHGRPFLRESLAASAGKKFGLRLPIISALRMHSLQMDVRVLSSPLENDPRVLSGESGAAGFGTAFELLFHKAQYQEEISSLGLNSESVLLFFNTEGVTDRKNFVKIVWEGAFAEKV